MKKKLRLYKSMAILWPILTIMCLYARAQEDIEWTPAASGQSTQQAHGGLEVGDTIPDELWDTPLSLWSVTDNKTKTVTLNDYRGKVIVLDFWSTHCTLCVYNMPRMLGLEEASPDKIQVLPVTKEDDTIVSNFFASTKYEPLIGLPVSSLVSDQVMYETFPSTSLPNLVVLDPNGRVAAITEAEYLDVPTLTAVFNDDPDVYIPRKRRRLEVPVLELSGQYAETNRLQGPLYYSTLSGYIDGIGHDMYWSVNHSAKSIRYYVGNTTVVKLYTAALSSPLPLKPKRRILEVKDPAAYVFDFDNYYNLDWRRANYYTYEILMPDNLSREKVRRKMRSDLDFMLGVQGRIEPRPVVCWVLRTKEGMQLTEGNGVALGGLVYAMNNDLALPFIINESGYDREKTTIETVLPQRQTLPEYNALLAPIGMELVEETRMLDMFVLTENHEK